VTVPGGTDRKPQLIAALHADPFVAVLVVELRGANVLGHFFLQDGLLFVGQFEQFRLGDEQRRDELRVGELVPVNEQQSLPAELAANVGSRCVCDRAHRPDRDDRRADDLAQRCHLVSPSL
jgi:hypothetical protein